MIRLSRGIRSSNIVNQRLATPSSLVARSFSKGTEDKPKGTPYSKLTVGVPKETFPLEKRVAATPEVSCFLRTIELLLQTHINRYHVILSL